MNVIREIGALFLSCSNYAADRLSSSESVLRISVLGSGRILLDGKKTTVSGVKQALEKAKSTKSTVWYYRESGKDQPPSQAIEIFKLAVESRLPIGLSSKSDFSDYIDDEGQSRPRK